MYSKRFDHGVDNGLISNLRITFYIIALAGSDIQIGFSKSELGFQELASLLAHLYIKHYYTRLFSLIQLSALTSLQRRASIFALPQCALIL
jgi:hypothetical protein